MLSRSNGWSFFAEVRFLSAEEGGRHTPPASGFHPQLKVGELLTSCVVESLDPKVSVFFLDQAHKVCLKLMFREEIEKLVGHPIADYFYEGGVVELYEGNKKIGQGSVIKIPLPEQVK